MFQKCQSFLDPKLDVVFKALYLLPAQRSLSAEAGSDSQIAEIESPYARESGVTIWLCHERMLSGQEMREAMRQFI